MKKRTQSREFAVQMMYQAELVNEPGKDDYKAEEIEKIFWKSFPAMMPEIKEFAGELFKSAFKNRQEHDRIISGFLKDSWSLERLGEMEKCVLRVAIDELLNTNTPAYAVLDDYVTLTKKFTDSQTASFVNGLLEKVRNTFAADKAGKVEK